MIAKNILELHPINVNSFSGLSRTGIHVPLQSSEQRLLSYSHNPERCRVELNCFSGGQHCKAYLPEIHYEKLQPFVGKTVRIESYQCTSGFESLYSIQHLSLVENAENPLATFLPLWLDPVQFDTYCEFVRLVRGLDPQYQALVHQIFRDDAILESFLSLPASLGHHHSIKGGLLTHTVEVALDCEMACQQYQNANIGLTITAALLHDIGKCKEYAKSGSDRYSRTQAGELEMHKILGATMVQLAANACDANPDLASEIVHCITAATGPAYMGLASQKMFEATLVQTADSRSASADLYRTESKYAFSFKRFGGTYMTTSKSQVKLESNLVNTKRQ
ncbi:MAG: HDIG domain-containing protein [Rhodoferax sp.]|nr:HDIG domain-containing protein [Rhodoferax sp.]MCF8210383.1 HDIG domain-containing protein [Rhodoferax sp.]